MEKHGSKINHTKEVLYWLVSHTVLTSVKWFGTMGPNVMIWLSKCFWIHSSKNKKER